VTRAIVLAGLAACAKVPPLAHENRALVVVDDVAVPHKVTADYTLVFADDGVRMPLSLTYMTRPLIGADPDCEHEQRIGIALSPVTHAAAGYPGESVVTTLIGNDDDTGSAVAQISVTYDAPFTCGTVEHHLTGETVFTFLPGRINRRDTVTPPALDMTSDCMRCKAGPMPTAYTLDTAWRVNLDRDGTADRYYLPDGTPYTTGDAPRGACIKFEGRLVGLQWHAEPSTEPRLANSAFILDWRRQTTIPATPRSARSDLVFSALTDATKCDDVLAGAVDPPLLVNDEEVTAGDDGIYLTSAVGDSITLAAADKSIRHGFAVFVPRILRHVYSVTKGGEPAAHVRQATADGYLFWFDDPLLAGETIELEVD